LTTQSVPAVRLATNGSAVFGITDHNGIWSLAAGDNAIRTLVPPGDTTEYSDEWGSRFVASGNDLYWLDRTAGALHRTWANLAVDEVLAAGLDTPDTLVVDDARIYWSEVSYMHQSGGVIRFLPRDAPGATPATLTSVDSSHAISSLAVSGGTLYWTSFISIGATVYYAGLFAASTDALLHGGSGTLIDGANPYGATAVGADVIYGYYRDSWTTALVDDSVGSGSTNLLSILPIEVGLVGLALADEWLIVSGRSEVGTELYVAPRDGAGLVRIAQGLQTPAIVGPAGITFVDASGALVFVKLADLGYIVFGHPAPQ
jgi:hypothetical protein